MWQGPLPDAPYRFLSVDAAYLGDSNFSFESLGGDTAIRLQNILDNTQRRGWSTSSIFSAEGPIVLEARFNTLVQSASTGIDELIEMWLLDAGNLARHDFVALLAPGFGEGRDFTGASTITGAGVDRLFRFANDTWYRMVILDQPLKKFALPITRTAARRSWLGVSFGHALSQYPSGMRIGLSQSMGFPQSPFPTDVAIDWIRLAVSQGATVVIGDCDAGDTDQSASGCRWT